MPCRYSDLGMDVCTRCGNCEDLTPDESRTCQHTNSNNLAYGHDQCENCGACE